MHTYDTIIRNGTVVDGMRNPARVADIGIKDGVIVEIGRLNRSDAQCVLDADNLIAAPGFIDLHTHYDSQLFWDPYCSSSSWHGVTTVVIGNCGYGFAPCRVEDRHRSMLTVTRVESVSVETLKSGMPWDWTTFPEYIDSVARAPKAINIAVNMPLSPLMVWVMGRDRAKAGVLPTDEEHNEMARLLNEGMDAGAIGFSVQRFGEGTNHPDFDGTPFPTDILHDETMLFLGDTLRERKEGYIQYSYLEAAECHGGEEGGPEQARARQHVEQLADRRGRNVLFYPCTKVDAGLEWVKSCHERGLPIYAQRPTVMRRLPRALVNAFESANALDGSPTWRNTMVGTVEEIIDKLNAADVRERLRKELSADDDVGSWILLHAKTQANMQYEGMTIGQIARCRNTNSYVDVFLDITIADGLKSDWSCPVFTNPDLAAFRRLPAYDNWIPGLSDGGAHTKNLNTTFYSTLFLMSFVRDDGWLSLEEAHYRLSALPAKVAGLRQNMGTLSVGAPADIVIYDLNNLSITEPQILRDYPANEWRLANHGVGYRWVLVNGEVIIDNDKETAVLPGRLVHSAESRRKSPGKLKRA